MSLLNDALKRAGGTDPDRPGADPSLPPLQAAEYPAEPNWGFRFLLVVLLVVTIGMSAFFLVRWSQGPTPGPGDLPRLQEVALAPPASPAPTPAEAQNSSSAKPSIRVSTNWVARDAAALPPPPPEPARATTLPPAVANPAPAVTPDAPVPALKLQSIIFRLRNPSAVINGEMLGVGETIKGARVVRIDRHSVTLERNGETNVLELPRL
jgi:hypothetical protein